MMITGTKNSGKSTLAKDLTIFFHQIGRLKSTRVAKIDAEKMNGIDVLSKKDTLRDSCLIVENASELNRATIDQLLELIKYFRGDIIVIFEENKKNINALFRECPKLMELFKNRIHLPETTKDL
jgi:predicted kinase